MSRGTPERVTAGVLSMLVPGAGQVYAGARRRGLLLIAVTGGLLLLAVTLAVTRPAGLAASVVDARLVAALVVANLALLGLRLFAVVDAWRGAVTPVALAALAVLVALTAAPHLGAAYVTVRGYDVLDSVFADEEPRDVLGGGGLF